MSRLLVLGAGEQAQRWSRLLTGRWSRSARTHQTRCEALVVVNDHSASSVANLQQALSLQRERPDLPVAVLTLVDASDSDTQAMARALSIDTPQGRVGITPAQGEALLQVLVSDDGLNFEFQGSAPKLKLQ